MAQLPPPQQQDQQPATLILHKFTGLKNTVSAERLTPEELERAVNIDLDDAGQPHRRRGRRKVASGEFHSLFTMDDYSVLGVKDNVLGRINADYSFTAIVPVDPNPIDYVQIGDTTYFTSVSQSGKIVGLAYSSWGQVGGDGFWYSPVVRPTPNLAQVGGRLLGKPPMAEFVAYNNGRIYLSIGNVVWFTELFNYNWVDRTRSFWQFEGDVTMLRSVSDGTYIGTTEGVWFVGGTAREPKRVRVMDGAVIKGSAVYIPAELGNPVAIQRKPDQELAVSVAFMTQFGFCVGQNSGSCYNLTEASHIFPQAARIAALFRRQDGVNQYIAVSDAGGTPAANTRIGDYVDAEVRRGGGNWIEQDEGVRLGDNIDIEIV